MEQKMPEHVDLVFDADKERQKQAPPPEAREREHPDVGTSSLFGRVGDNVTLHARGYHKHGTFESVFPRAYKDLLKAAFAMLRAMFIGK